MRGNKGFQQTSAFTLWSFLEQAFPARDCRFQFAPTDLHVPERSVDGCELFARQHEDALAGCAAAVTFSEDLGQFANGKPDCESASDEADALERLRRKQPVSRRKSATGRSSFTDLQLDPDM